MIWAIYILIGLLASLAILAAIIWYWMAGGDGGDDF